MLILYRHTESVEDLAETTIVYNHGRYASIDHYMPRIQMLHELGVNVYVWDYQGYGKSLPRRLQIHKTGWTTPAQH